VNATHPLGLQFALDFAGELFSVGFDQTGSKILPAGNRLPYSIVAFLPDFFCGKAVVKCRL
jgi:hypothetical protein